MSDKIIFLQKNVTTTIYPHKIVHLHAIRKSVTPVKFSVRRYIVYTNPPTLVAFASTRRHKKADETKELQSKKHLSDSNKFLYD